MAEPVGEAAVPGKSLFFSGETCTHAASQLLPMGDKPSHAEPGVTSQPPSLPFHAVLRARNGQSRFLPQETALALRVSRGTRAQTFCLGVVRTWLGQALAGRAAPDPPVPCGLSPGPPAEVQAWPAGPACPVAAASAHPGLSGTCAGAARAPVSLEDLQAEHTACSLSSPRHLP